MSIDPAKLVNATVTGRVSCSKANFQNIPKKPATPVTRYVVILIVHEATSPRTCFLKEATTGDFTTDLRDALSFSNLDTAVSAVHEVRTNNPRLFEFSLEVRQLSFSDSLYNFALRSGEPEYRSEGVTPTVTDDRFDKFVESIQ